MLQHNLFSDKMHKNSQIYFYKINKKEEELLEYITISCFTYFNSHDRIQSSEKKQF